MTSNRLTFDAITMLALKANCTHNTNTPSSTGVEGDLVNSIRRCRKHFLFHSSSYVSRFYTEISETFKSYYTQEEDV